LALALALAAGAFAGSDSGQTLALALVSHDEASTNEPNTGQHTGNYRRLWIRRHGQRGATSNEGESPDDHPRIHSSRLSPQRALKTDQHAEQEP
jgi:hypothetical protein